MLNSPIHLVIFSILPLTLFILLPILLCNTFSCQPIQVCASTNLPQQRQSSTTPIDTTNLFIGACLAVGTCYYGGNTNGCLTHGCANSTYLGGICSCNADVQNASKHKALRSQSWLLVARAEFKLMNTLHLLPKDSNCEPRKKTVLISCSRHSSSQRGGTMASKVSLLEDTQDAKDGMIAMQI
jgi:hypothetical protein